LFAGAKQFEGTFITDRIGALENPVLPRAQTAEYFSF
jgi:hypothetical protein